jgi:hypothetical protein
VLESHAQGQGLGPWVLLLHPSTIPNSRVNVFVAMYHRGRGGGLGIVFVIHREYLILNGKISDVRIGTRSMKGEHIRQRRYSTMI